MISHIGQVLCALFIAQPVSFVSVLEVLVFGAGKGYTGRRLCLLLVVSYGERTFTG